MKKKPTGKRKYWIHVVSEGKLIGVGYGTEEEIKKGFPVLRKLVEKKKIIEGG